MRELLHRHPACHRVLPHHGRRPRKPSSWRHKNGPLRSGAERAIEDFLLTRYACYLIVQTGHPQRKPNVFAQSYLAVQTRKEDHIEGRMLLVRWLEAREKLRASQKALSHTIFERGMDDAG